MSQPVRPRVHLITGFLGTGKTTTILHWLQQRPQDQKWAVLVNEFGDVGVDGAILKQLGDGVAVREVAGGCLCCVSGLPFQIGLNMLIAREKPDVLLIEPTGLGHPRQILQILRQPTYQNTLEIGTTVTLVDPRHLSQQRYRQHEIYADQLAVADVLVANKIDLCSADDLQAFDQLVESQPLLASARVQQGQVSIDVLQALPEPVSGAASDTGASAQAVSAPALLVDLQMPLALAAGETGKRLQKEADGLTSVGWLLAGNRTFRALALADWLGNLDCERGKALMNTDEGSRIYNLREGVLSEVACDPAGESRLELILHSPVDADALEQALLACEIPLAP